MQPTVPAPPIPLFGIMTVGFAYFAFYVLVRLSKDGQERFQTCKKTMFVGALVLVVVALLESLSYWDWLIQNPQAYQFPVFITTMIIGLQFITIMCVDLGVQWYLLKR